MSVESRFIFFRRGVTTACFCEHGRLPSRSEMLISAVRKGSRTSSISFRMEVGIGSRMHDFVGDIMTARLTSSSEHCLNSPNFVVVKVDIPGGVMPSVFERTLAIFFSKKLANELAVIVDGRWLLVFLSRLRIFAIDFHSLGELRESPDSRALQYASFLAWKSTFFCLTAFVHASRSSSVFVRR